jgi:hypothetical protein
MKENAMELVSSLDEISHVMDRFHQELPDSDGLAGRLGQAHAYYVLPDEQGEPRFCFSKFLGYRNNSARKYLKSYNHLDGRNTEHALKPWFQEVLPGSSTYETLFARLTDWLAGYGKRPRGGDFQHTRIMVLRPEWIEPVASASTDRKLLELLIAVAVTLPIAQRNELRAAI